MEYFWLLFSNCKKIREKVFVIRVYIVFDNFGFEFVIDLILVDFLLFFELVIEVYFYGKIILWFVFDIIIYDFNWLIEQVKYSNYKWMFKCGVDWEEYIKMGKWVYYNYIFWILFYEYCVMFQVVFDLYVELQKVYLILFKGDLNYRKLIGDRKWEFFVLFYQVLNGFYFVLFCIIRILKVEIQVGLQFG